jgi:O-antigen/teichoic acid export membrane protein
VTTDAESDTQTLETRILRGAGWMALGFGSRQLVSWLSMLLLVRLLDPDAFGVVAVAYVIISALVYLRGSGIWAALVYRRTEIEEAASSAFVYVMLSSVAVYLVCFAAAPLFAWAFKMPELTAVLRVMALMIVFAGVDVVPGAMLERELKYSAFARIDLGTAVVQLTASVGLALAGAGVWSLVTGQVAAAAFGAVAIWAVTPWRPSLRLAKWSAVRELFRYGRFAGAANIATFFSGILDTVTVGRVLGATAVGFYSIAFRVATIPESVFSFLIVKAMFPAFSIVQEDREAFRRIFVQHAQRMALIVLPATIFVALAAEPIVLTLLGEEWSSVITPVRILAVFGFVRALSATANAVFRGAGKPHVTMWFALANIALLVPALIVLTKSYELDGAATAVLVCATATTLPAVYRMIRLVGLSAGSLLRTLWPALACSAILALLLAALIPATRSTRPVVSLAVMLAVGGLGYVASTALLARSIVVPMWLDLRGTRS